MADPIKIALEEAKARIDKLWTKRKQIDAEILDWKRVIDSLCAVSEDVSDTLPPDLEIIVTVQGLLPGVDNPKLDSPPTKLTFTEAIRTILRLRADEVVPVPKIRDELMDCGFDFSKYKQKLVPVHNAMKRLEEQGEVRAVKNDQGCITGYQWIAPIERAFKEEHDWAERGGLTGHMQATMKKTLRELARNNPAWAKRLGELAEMKRAEKEYEAKKRETQEIKADRSSEVESD